MNRPGPNSVARFSLLLSLVCLVPACSLGQLSFEYVPLDNSFFAYERDVGDIDGDGDNDVIGIQEGDTTLQVFRAPSWARSTLFTFSGTFRYPRADDFKVADIDGDGDVDVVTRLGDGPASDAAGLAVWCENTGGGTNFTQHLIGNSLEYVKDMVVADFDRDDRLDVAMRMDHQTQLWLQEAGGGWTEVLLNHPAHEGMEAGDLDMDGDPDIILNGFWLATPNTPAAARVAMNYTNRVIDGAWFDQGVDWTADSCKVVVGDFDGDGTNDVAFSQSERPGYTVAWYRSATPHGAGPWIRQNVAVVDYCHNLQAADWDLDGDVDLLVGGMIQSQHRGLKLMLNNGGGTNWTEFVIQSDGSYSAETGDIDNDSDLDVVGIRNWNSAPTYIYRNNASDVPTVAQPLIVPNGGVFDEPLAVTLSCPTAGAEIRFTTDGTAPTNQPPSVLYTNAISVTTSLTLKARAFKTNQQPSLVTTAGFVGPKVRTPVLAPPGGTFSSTQAVTISCATTGAVIRFTTNGADPQEADTIYTGALTLTQTTTLKSRAFRPGLMPSDVAGGTFTLFTFGAVAHWRLDERFGAVAADSSGNGHSGTVAGPLWTAGQRDNALSFDGVDDRVECGAWDLTGAAATFCAWIKLDPAFVDNDARILSKAVGIQEQDHWWMLSTTMSGGERRLRARLKAGGSTVTLIAASGNLALNTWHHVTASYNGATLRLFVNGTEVGSAAKTGALDANNSAAIWIGANPPAATAPFRGLIDDVRIYNTAMDATAVTAVMNEIPARTPPQLLSFERTAAGWSVLGAGEIGHYLHLQRATNLSAPDWQTVATQALSGTLASFEDTNQLSQAFYRLSLD